jgi:hypothetical protein
MCNFISWIEDKDGKIWFMDNKDLAEYKRFRPDKIGFDCRGHFAIRKYHGAIGKERECTDFSTPKMFPRVIVQAIKSGRMSQHGVFPEGLLLPHVHSRIKDGPVKGKAAYRIAWNRYLVAKQQYVVAKQQDGEAWEWYSKIVPEHNKTLKQYIKAGQRYYENLAAKCWKAFQRIENREPMWR